MGGKASPMKMGEARIIGIFKSTLFMPFTLSQTVTLVLCLTTIDGFQTNLQKLQSSHFLNLDISIANDCSTIRNIIYTIDLNL